MKKYSIELEGQLDFYEAYLRVVDSSLTVDYILVDNTDGILNGNLLEFKLNINDLNSALFQAIKYLSALRIKGKPVPANIILISLNDGKAYYFHSADYLTYIERVYMGGASKDNSGFMCGRPLAELSYVENQSDEAKLIFILREKKFVKIHIDENDIVGWATSYYRQFPNARKSDFIGDLTGKVNIVGEIRNPDKFKEYIYPYEGEDNTKFQYLMDKLNDTLQKKNLGAFYTPTLYAEKSLELVREAIRRVPAGNDYIILDRCAGTGNLELGLTDDEKSHAILSTFEYYEYKVLLEILGDKVRYIIPPIEKEDTFNMGLVRGADALSEEYINNPVIKQYIDNPKCTVILFENPPYAEVSIEHRKRFGASKKATAWKQSYVVTEMKKEVKGTAVNELGSVFIWSGFHFYLRQPTDSYIVYSPAKYWKFQHLVNKKFIKGFAFNRRFFHTNINACIMCILWSNRDSFDTVEFELDGYNIVGDVSKKLQDIPEKLPIKRIFTLYSDKYFDKRVFQNDKLEGIAVALDGTERFSGITAQPRLNSNILGYMCVAGSNFDNPDLQASLLVATRYEGHGFFLRKDNYLAKLPMFAASRYITYNRGWTERGRVMKSADGADRFARDVENGKLKQFLLKCLLFTCMEKQNHMRTFIGSDGRFYRNELCLDGTNGETIALRDIKGLALNKKEKWLLRQWEIILQYAKACDGYNASLTYGVYQIFDELDTFTYDEKTRQKHYVNAKLHGALLALKTRVKDYYNSEIVPTLFEYEFLK